MKCSLYSVSLLLFFAFSFINITAVTVTAQILNEASEPIADVTVTDGYKRIFSNAKGIFTIKTNSDSLIISKLGYTRRIILTADVKQIIRLESKPIVLPSVKVYEHYNFGNTALDKVTLTTTSDGDYRNTSESLFKSSSVFTNSTRLIGENQTVSLLGNLSRHTLIMYNNVPLNPNGEAYDLSSLPWESINRIEIVKGNASLYEGASAIGGIIYLYSTDNNSNSALKLENKTEIGSFSQFKQINSYEQISNIFDIRLSISRQKAKNDFGFKPRKWWNMQGSLKRNNNSKKQNGVSFYLSNTVNNLNWIYNLDSEQIYRQLPGPVNFPEIYKHAFLTGQNLRQSLNVNHKIYTITNSLTLWQNNDYTSYNNTRATNPVYPSHYNQNQSSLGIKYKSDFESAPAFIGSIIELNRYNYERKDLLNPNFSIDKVYRNQAAVAIKSGLESKYHVFINKLQAGIRLDDVTDFGSFISWRLEELIKTDTDIELKAGATLGNSFCLPSFYDLYWKGDAQSLGNPDLKPETSFGNSIWMGVCYTDYSFTAAFHNNEVKKLIQWRQTYLYGIAWKPVNIGKALIRSMEFEANAEPCDRLKLRSAVTLTKSKDITNSNNYYLTYTPDTRWVTDIDFFIWMLKFNLNADYTGKQWTTPDNLIKPLCAFTLFNTAISYRHQYKKLSTDIHLQFNNLFDKQYEIYAYVPQPGFNWLLGINVNYKI